MNDEEILQQYCHMCAAGIGERHTAGCDVARCSKCGVQQHACEDHPDAEPSTWHGDWPGKLECREFGFWTAPDSFWGVTEDLNRLYASGEAEWDVTLERFVLR